MTLQATRGDHPLRVLLAEDDHSFRGLVASTLRDDGYEVLEARDGVELLAHVEAILAGRRAQDAPFVVVTDVEMPQLGGLDVLTILRCAFASTPVILITAFGDRETHAEAQELGVIAVLDKPFPLDVLRAAVRQAALAR
jgi:CheY-like chemotaxis protein